MGTAIDFYPAILEFKLTVFNHYGTRDEAIRTWWGNHSPLFKTGEQTTENTHKQIIDEAIISYNRNTKLGIFLSG